MIRTRDAALVMLDQHESGDVEAVLLPGLSEGVEPFGLFEVMSPQDDLDSPKADATGLGKGFHIIGGMDCDVDNPGLHGLIESSMLVFI
jgi:hypothetical protein